MGKPEMKSLKRHFEQIAGGHGHGCPCGACSAEYVSGNHYGLDSVLLWRMAAAAVLFVAALVLKNLLPAVSVLLSVVSVLVSGYEVFIRAAAACVRNKLPDENLLMCTAAVACIAVGRAPEGALVLLLMQIGTLLGGYVAEKNRRILQSVQDECVDFPDNGYHSGRTQEFMTHFTHIYTPVILGLGILFAVALPLFFRMTIAESVYKAVILLVIACPCAFLVSVPLACKVGAGRAVRNGVLFRDAGAIEEFSRVGTIVFDLDDALKGEGIRVVSVKSDYTDAETLLRIAAHACAYADNPMAESIKAAYVGTIYIELIQSFRQEDDAGVSVVVDGVGILLGTEDFIRAHGVEPGKDATDDPSAYLAIDGRYAGRIVFGAVAKTDAARVIQFLSWENERQIYVFSGDTTSATEKFSRSVGVGQFYADCTPEKKADLLRNLRERKTKRGNILYVGDPEKNPECFANAELGVAMNADEAGIASAVALDGSPLSIVAAINAANQTNTIIRQNFLFVLIFKLIVLVLDILGACPLWLAVFADSGVTLAAILNCLRGMTTKQTADSK